MFYRLVRTKTALRSSSSLRGIMAAATLCAAAVLVLSACSAAGVPTSGSGLPGELGPAASAIVLGSAGPTASDGPGTGDAPADSGSADADPRGGGDPASTAADSATDDSSGDATGVCDLVDSQVVGKIVGASVTSQSAADAACVYSTADAQENVEILKLPSSVLAGQVARESLTAVDGVGDKAYWSAADGTLFAVKGDTELAVQATLNSAAPDVERACVAIATAALRAL